MSLHIGSARETHPLPQPILKSSAGKKKQYISYILHLIALTLFFWEKRNILFPQVFALYDAVASLGLP
jgi:hypothetical protein